MHDLLHSQQRLQRQAISHVHQNEYFVSRFYTLFHPTPIRENAAALVLYQEH